jgi:hypothetical protein
MLAHVVDAMVQLMLHGDMTPHDIARAATLAATIYAERYNVPITIALMPDDNTRITTLADKIRDELLVRLNTEQHKDPPATP